MAGSARRIVVEFIGNGSDLKRELNDLEGKSSSFAGKFGKAVGGAALIAGAGLLKIGADSVQAGSMAQQSLGATETVFGKFADRVIKDSGKAADEFGLSANQYRENANLIGSLFKNQGVALDELAGKTKGMIGTAADLSATFGGTTKEAVEALGSAFKGEFDPLEKYGISLKASTVNAEALKVANVANQAGFDALTPAVQAAAKQQATANLIQKQSADSAGAFAKESDTLAHKQQVLAAKFEDVKAKLGTALLPVVTKFADYLITDGIPAAQKIAAKFQEWQPQINKVAGFLGDLFQVLGKVAGFLITNGIPAIVQMAKPMYEGAAAAVEFGKKIYHAGEQVAEFVKAVREKIDAAMGIVKNIPSLAKTAIGNLGSTLWSAGSDIIQGLIDGIQAKLGALKDKLSSVTKLIPDWKGPEDKDRILLTPAGEALMEGLIKGIDKGKVKLKTVLEKLTAFISKHQQKLADLLAKRAAVVEAFQGMTSSLFSTDLSTGEGEAPKTIQALLDFQAQAKAKAQQLAASVKALISKGLSKDLLHQLMAAGEAGQEQINLLATGTAEQIQQANADNLATQMALQEAGLAASEAMGIEEAIKQEERDLKLAETIKSKLDELMKQQDKNTVVMLKISKHVLYASLLELKRQRGASLDL